MGLSDFTDMTDLGVTSQAPSSTGVGKAWIACALSHKAYGDNRSVAYHRMPGCSRHWRVVAFKEVNAPFPGKRPMLRFITGTRYPGAPVTERHFALPP